VSKASKRSYRYGWVRDLPDHRDLHYSAPGAVLTKLPKKVDLRPGCPPVYDQGHLGSCTANALAGAYAFCLQEQGKPVFMPSRLFIYYNERSMEGTVASDAGAQLRDGIKTLNAQGVCPEPLWPYVITAFAKKPPAKAYTAAQDHQALSYQRVLQSLTQMKGCLAEGFPFVVGFTVYEGFETPAVARTGKGDLPGPGERVIGGHAVVVVGYDDAQQRFILRNSWSDKWGMKGYFTLPYAYLVDAQLAADLWTVRIVEG
jgi:C1A family cysteine protease